ncbi:peptidase S9 [Philodulcilactobacillus myokoensis]|uniref:Peptidase S9 n=1 Tax=Philodulcilactobacillus myokoensis TaxID=2929573 RepID=A0A9W6B070_9LACO|nr:S9 family peptidase [Philodulcilactobacillus myokoensis]GLB46525.1 peptidase S9 [Philodulcilactobacillus myokoensis]
MKQGVQINDLYQLKTVSHPVRFGGFYFFSENGMDAADNQYTSVIMSVDNDFRVHQWTAGCFDSHPVSNGNDLFFIRKTSTGNQVMQIDFEHQNVKKITNGFPVSDLHASDDGKWLIYKTTETNESPKFKTSQFPPIRYVNKLNNRIDGMGWLPNHVTYRLHTLNLQNHQSQVLLKQSEPFEIKSISSDGNQIVYLQANHPEIKNDYDISKGVYIFDRESLQVTFVTEKYDQGIFQDASFSADSQKLALVGNNNTHYNQTVNDLWVYSLSDYKLKNMTHALDDVDVGYEGGISTDLLQQARNHAVLWINAHQYVFHAFHHGHSQLYTGNEQGVKLIKDDSEDIYDLNVFDENNLMMCISDQSHPSKLGIFDLSKKTFEPVFNPNNKYEQDHHYATSYAFKFKTFDHQTEGGWVLMPKVKSNQKVPVILYVHGGPHAFYGETFFHEFQALTSKGYAIVFVNPRGSTTYGQNFQDAVNGHYGEGDYQDILSGLDAALGQFNQLDANHVAIVGGSYGGFMVTWAVSHTNRFQAAIAQRPLVDWQSLYTTSDIGNRYVREEMQTDLFKDPDARDIYWQHSPLAYAMNVKTPLRIQHGEWDMRCPTNQSEAFFNAIQQNGVKSDYLRYPQSFHGMSRNGLPNLRIRRLEDILEWLDRYLKN